SSFRLRLLHWNFPDGGLVPPLLQPKALLYCSLSIKGQLMTTEVMLLSFTTNSLADWEETEDSDDGEETEEPQSDVNPQNKEVPVGDVNCSTGNTSISSPECAGSSDHKGHLEKPTSSKTGEKPFQCSVCDKRFGLNKTLKRHMTVHTGEKPFQCSLCEKRYGFNNALKRHMAVHTDSNINLFS
uniref:C2H2-type domain-containing protein n=1 Tax=Cyclopterus lumpus TaxID=8103 RepID=A0A8C2WSV2_CYCLU